MHFCLELDDNMSDHLLHLDRAKQTDFKPLIIDSTNRSSSFQGPRENVCADFLDSGAMLLACLHYLPNQIKSKGLSNKGLLESIY